MCLQEETVNNKVLTLSMQATHDDEHELSAKYDDEIQFFKKIYYVHMLVTENDQVSAILTRRIYCKSKKC